MQNIEFIGNLVREPQTRTTGSGKSVCNFTVAVDRKFKGTDGEKVTDFFDVSAWGNLASVCEKYLAKGKKVYVCGELQARTYEAKGGGTRMSLCVSASEVEFLSPRSEKKVEVPEESSGYEFSELSQDDIPF